MHRIPIPCVGAERCSGNLPERRRLSQLLLFPCPLLWSRLLFPSDVSIHLNPPYTLKSRGAVPKLSAFASIPSSTAAAASLSFGSSRTVEWSVCCSCAMLLVVQSLPSRASFSCVEISVRDCSVDRIFQRGWFWAWPGRSAASLLIPSSPLRSPLSSQQANRERN